MQVDFRDDAEIRAACQIEHRALVTENFPGRFLQGRQTGTAGVHQRAVDVEEVEHDVGMVPPPCAS